MKLSKVNNTRFFKEYDKGSLYKLNETKKLDLDEHIKLRMESSQKTFRDIFTMLNKNNKYSKELSDIIKEYAIEYSKLSLGDILKINTKIKNKTIEYRSLNSFNRIYKERLKRISKKDGELFAFDVNKTKEINSFFKWLNEKYAKNFLAKNAKKSIENNRIEIADNKEKWLRSITADEDKIKLERVYKKLRFLILGEEKAQFTNNFSKDIMILNDILRKDDSKNWNEAKWYDSLNFVKRIYAQLKDDLSEEEKYDYEIIVGFLKEVIIDLKPNINGKGTLFVKMYDGFKDSSTVPLEKIINLIINKTMGKIKNYFVSNIISCGKKVYLEDTFKSSKLSGNYYELQKAYDEIRVRNITAISFATNTINNLFNKEDNFKDLDNMVIKNNNEKVEDKYKGYVDEKISLFFSLEAVKDYIENNYYAFVQQVISNLYSLRNNDFHFIKSGQNVCSDKLEKFVKIELDNYYKIINQKIDSIKLNKYYKKEELLKVFKDIQGQKNIVPFMPSFRKIKKYLELSKIDIESNIEEQQVQKNAEIYLLKEIYTTVFTNHFLKKKFTIIEEFKTCILNDNDKGKKAFTSLEGMLGGTMAEVANMLLTKYMIDNSSLTKKVKDDHLKIILNQLVAKEFEKYIEDNYKFLKEDKNNEINDLNKISEEELKQIFDYKIDKIDISFYILARLIPNSIVSDLSNSYSKFLQFTKDIAKKFKLIEGVEISHKNLLTLLGYSEDDINKIVYSLNMALEYNSTYGIKSDEGKSFINEITPFFEDGTFKDEYYEDIFVQDGKNVIYHGSIINLEKNFIYDKISKIYNDSSLDLKVKKRKDKDKKEEEMDKYISLSKDGKYKNIINIYEKIANSRDQVTEDDWKKVNEYVALKNRVLLQDISDYSTILTEIQSHLISYFYKYERDTMYFLLGLDYLRKSVKKPEINNIFSYQEKGGSVNKKLSDYLKNSMNAIFKKYYDEYIVNSSKVKIDNKTVRNSIDHFDGFKKDKSFFEIIVNTYKVLGYDRKLQNSVFKKLINILEKHRMDISKCIEFKSSSITLNKDKAKNIEVEIKVKDNSYKAFNKNEKYSKIFLEILDSET